MRQALSTTQPSIPPSLSATHTEISSPQSLAVGLKNDNCCAADTSDDISHVGAQRETGTKKLCERRKKKKWWNFRDGLLAKQFVINLSVKTDGKPQGSGSAKTLYRRIFRNTVFCYYAGKPLLHTITMTVVVFDIQNRSLVLHHWGQKKLFQWLSAATNRREIIWFECRQEESIIPQNPWF